MTTYSAKGPGTYCSCNVAANGENYDEQYARFFLKHPNLQWVSTTGNVAYTVPGAIKTGIHQLGRKYLTTNSGNTVQAGKVEGASFYYKHPNQNGEIPFAGPIEVLVCVP